jgi:hypothetical protein
MTSPGNGAVVPVGEVKSSFGTGTEQVDTQTHEIGLIIPPPDIKAIADKTAQFVAKNGTFVWHEGLLRKILFVRGKLLISSLPDTSFFVYIDRIKF